MRLNYSMNNILNIDYISQLEEDTSQNPTRSEFSDTKQLVLESVNRLGPSSNLPQTGFNYVNSIIGSGVIGKRKL